MARPLPLSPAPLRGLQSPASTTPPPMRSETRLTAPSEAAAVVIDVDESPQRGSLHTLFPTCAADLHRAATMFRHGDFHGALLCAMRALDERPTPTLNVSPTYISRLELANAERLLLALVDGNTALEEIIDATGLGLLEGIDAICHLEARGVIAFDGEATDDPITLPG